MSFNLCEEAKIVSVLAPIDMSSSALTAVWISMKNAKNLTYMIETGVLGAHTAVAVTLNVANDVLGTKSAAITTAAAHCTLTMPYVYKRTTATDTLAKTAVVSSTFNITSTDDGRHILIPVDAAKMGVFTASSVVYNATHVALTIAALDASAIMSVTAILTGLRYEEDVPPTAIT